ncbi:hypothetical protein ON010_g18332 [Phytophthora cinnamomi]|nr:hypothetical protein ON010_g18332 [Phytophthora cinnamomi]
MIHEFQELLQVRLQGLGRVSEEEARLVECKPDVAPSTTGSTNTEIAEYYVCVLDGGIGCEIRSASTSAEERGAWKDSGQTSEEGCGRGWISTITIHTAFHPGCMNTEQNLFITEPIAAQARRKTRNYIDPVAKRELEKAKERRSKANRDQQRTVCETLLRQVLELANRLGSKLVATSACKIIGQRHLQAPLNSENEQR